MMPAYAGLISSMGLAFLLQTVYLLPLTVVALLMVVAALGYRARRRRGYGPFVVGLIAAALFLIGKFVLEVVSVTYGGTALLIVASVWNTWPIKSLKSQPIQLAIPKSDS
ncbi:MAG: MerC family mercury resistance protein [Pirellulaceae bacterium]